MWDVEFSAAPSSRRAPPAPLLPWPRAPDASTHAPSTPSHPPPPHALTPRPPPPAARAQADRRALNITLNSIGTELTRDDRRKLYANFGLLYPHGQARARGPGGSRAARACSSCACCCCCCCAGLRTHTLTHTRTHPRTQSPTHTRCCCCCCCRPRALTTSHTHHDPHTHTLAHSITHTLLQAELAVAEDFDQIRTAMEKCPPYAAIFSRVRVICVRVCVHACECVGWWGVSERARGTRSCCGGDAPAPRFTHPPTSHTPSTHTHTHARAQLGMGETQMLDKILYEEEVHRAMQTFEQQFHYGVFYA